ncbi:MAG TPA: MSMEG_1061 family FMN-dependent PPOX-type flavoprotein [Solirubrobacteraceae bacterium]|nr:MSMEG_1061 family FMN-dependent PPOX-type flavoprotein [Solirubrobacteraceae bacterium]
MTARNETWSVVADSEQLRDLVGPQIDRVVSRPTLHEIDRQWLAAAPLCIVSSAAADGTCDVSPKGDPPGFAHVLDDRTIAIPDRPGNRRADGFHNVLGNPHVGLLFVVPGRTDTLRINGSAELLHDAPFFDEMTVAGQRPGLALVVHVEEVFYHCAKAFLRSATWDPSSWAPGGLPSRAEIVRRVERP